jgi:hypothetical protein
MSSPRFLLLGAASEFSLRPLAAALAARGLPVVAVDLAQEPVTASSAPPGDGPLVVVTSQHLAMTGDVYDAYSGISTHVLSPQALKRVVGAELLVYVPHDLADPVLPWEVPFLPLLDLYVAPDESSWWARAHVPTVVAGWVGAADRGSIEPSQQVRERGILFVTSVRWIEANGGGARLVDGLRATLGHGLAVKLPDWPGMEGLDRSLREAGATVLDPRTPASALIAAAPLVVTTSTSSIIAEAVLGGHRPVCVLPDGADEALSADLPLFDVLVCRDEEFPAAVSGAGRVRGDAATFDLDVFLGAVRARLEALAHV